MSVEDCQVGTQQMREGGGGLTLLWEASRCFHYPIKSMARGFVACMLCSTNTCKVVGIGHMQTFGAPPMLIPYTIRHDCCPYCMLHPYINECQTIEQMFWFIM